MAAVDWVWSISQRYGIHSAFETVWCAYQSMNKFQTFSNCSLCAFALAIPVPGRNSPAADLVYIWLTEKFAAAG